MPSRKSARTPSRRASSKVVQQPPSDELVAIDPVDGLFLSGVPAASQAVDAELAAELVATGAFTYAGDARPSQTGATAVRDAQGSAGASDGETAGEGQPGETSDPPDPAPADQADKQPEGPAENAGSSDSQEN